jgi:trimethylamine--corrinoid protein Co-methyltransferase
MWLDEIRGRRRYAQLADVVTSARFADALEKISVVGAMADPQDIPVEVRCIEVVAALIRTTEKPITFWFHDRKSAGYIVDLCAALRGSERDAKKYPLCYHLLEPISPLRFPFDGIDVLYEINKIDLPVQIGPMAQTGMSAPMSLAGTMAQENAEILAGVCITQAICPGTAVCYGGICHAFDMATTQLIFAGPEQAIFGVAMTQIGRSYGLPVYINVGLTDSKMPDAQAGLEAGITLALGAAAGADIFGHLGICGVDQASSLDMLLVQHEIIRYVESTLRDIDFSDEAMGLDVLEQVGPGGVFIGTDHTAKRFRHELWFPRLLDRRFYQSWLDEGGTSMEDRCRVEKEEILHRHTTIPVSEELDREISAIVRRARDHLGTTS